MPGRPVPDQPARPDPAEPAGRASHRTAEPQQPEDIPDSPRPKQDGPEGLLRQLAEHLRAVFWWADAPSGRLLYVSPAYEEVWGRTCNDLYRDPGAWRRSIHPEDRAAAAPAFRHLLGEGAPYEQEYRIVRPDGSVRWVRDRGFPLRNPQGQMEHVAGLAEDISPQKVKDEELRRHVRQQEVLAVLGRSALAGVGLQPLLEGAVRLVAHALKVEHAIVWEWSLDEHVLRVRAAVGRGTEPVGRETAQAGPESQPGYTLHCEGPVFVEDLRTDGRFRDLAPVPERAVSGVSVVIPGSSRPFGVLAAHAARPRQFTPEDGRFLQAVANLLAEAIGRRQAEEALRESERFGRAVLDSLAAHVAVLDRQGTIRAVNGGWERFAGENGARDAARSGPGVNYLEVCHRAAEGDCGDATAVLRGLEGVLSGSLPLFTFEYGCHAPGRRRWFLLRATPCATVRGGAVVAHIDISERKQAEESLKETARRKDEFLALLAHELRNPLAPIRNALHVLGMPDSGADGGWLREMMERQVRHLSRLVDGLVDASRMASGKIELRKETIDLGRVVQETVDTLRPLIEGAGLGLTVSPPADPLRLEADPTRLAQVLDNLLRNAARYTDPGGHVWLTAVRQGGEIVLTVRDTGVGIAPEMLACIFDPFVQGERRLDRSQGGLGLGLTLVKRLVELHGGTIKAHSEGPGRGSAFVVRLPALAEEPLRETGPDPAGGSACGGGACRRLLVVDDNQDAAGSLATLLRLQGHDVRVAHDGPTALELAAGYRPEVVFLDIGMPGMDGYEVSRRLRDLPGLAGIVLVAVTGWGTPEDHQRSREAGFDRHLVKPVEPEVLREVLAERG